uniref:Uncharacterized protein n=1 Tax=Nymphaea colorata TaxID=210225 RepID=A0A5K1DHW2_9MAGN
MRLFSSLNVPMNGPTCRYLAMACLLATLLVSLEYYACILSSWHVLLHLSFSCALLFINYIYSW